MSKRLKCIILIIAVILIITVAVISYYVIKDTKSYPTLSIKENCDVNTYEFMSRKIFKIAPKDGKKNDKVILYFHGGAYLAEMTDKHWNFIEKLVNDTGSTIILPDYPLAPKYDYKDVLKMVIPFYKEAMNRVKMENLIIMGDSAGGGLTLSLEEELIQSKIPIPEKTILISPWLDISMSNSEIETVQKNDIELNKDTLTLAGIAYAKGLDPKNHLVSPLYGDLSKLKNIIVFTGTYDILNPDVHLLQDKAKDVGTKIEIKEYEQAQHIWIINENCNQTIVEKAYKDLLDTLNT